MLIFREEKSPDDEIKAWQFWHSRQHSVKQRILDAGESKNKYSNVEQNRKKLKPNNEIYKIIKIKIIKIYLQTTKSNSINFQNFFFLIFLLKFNFFWNIKINSNTNSQ